jgi:hypothetical protein
VTVPYRLRRTEDVAIGVRRLVREQLCRGVEEINDPRLDVHTTVHQVRKRCKKIRGALRLVRYSLDDGDDDFADANAFFRDAARELSGARDAQTMLAAFEGLDWGGADPETQPTVSSVRARLAANRDEVQRGDDSAGERLAVLAGRFEEAGEWVGGWTLGKKGFAALAEGLDRTYRRGRVALSVVQAEPTDANYHEWRKRLKYHWYHQRILRNVWKPVMQARIGEARRLADLLGDDHDLAVLQSALLGGPDLYGSGESLAPVLHAITAKQADLRAQADALGRRMYAEKPKQFIRRMHALWKAWR